jgi:hypothetical protein
LRFFAPSDHFRTAALAQLTSGDGTIGKDMSVSKRTALLLVVAAGCGSKRNELRFEDGSGGMATVIEERSGDEVRTEVRLNGITTWSRRFDRSAKAGWRGAVVTEFQWPSSKLIREESYRLSGDGRSVDAKARRTGADGAVAESSWNFEVLEAAAAPPATSCSGDELSILEADLRRALQTGFSCMRRHKRGDIPALILARRQRAPLVFACVRSQDTSATGFLAAMDSDWYLGISDALKLSVHKQSYFVYPEGGRVRTVWHEVLHLWTGPHSPGFVRGEESIDTDRTNACVSLCFDRRPSRGVCELCLAAPGGDAGCEGLP